jgi:hypothetical protein
MKQKTGISKLLLICMAVITTLSTCDYTYFEYPETSAAYILKNAVLTERKPSQLSFYLDVLILNELENDRISEEKLIEDSCFKLLNFQSGGVNFTYQINSVELVSEQVTDSFETLILIENSYGAEGAFYNGIIESINGFTRRMPQSSRYCMSYFSRDSSSRHDVIEIDQDSFCSAWSEKAAERLFLKAKNQKGTSSFYDALHRAVDFMDSFGSYPDKSITVFAVNKDDGQSKYSLDQVISYAISKKISINLIWLSTDQYEDWRAIQRIPSETGGIGCIDGNWPWRLSTVFLSMPNILQNKYKLYRISAKVSVNFPNNIQLPFYNGLLCDRWNSPFDLEWIYFSLNK